MPPDATPAHQADALAALLDALDIDRIDVIGESAGATSALQLALRHPVRVSLESGGHLMLGQTKTVRDERARFFAETPNRTMERVAS